MIRLIEPLGAQHGAFFDGARRIHSRRSAHQLIEVFETPDLGRLLRIDGANMVAERDEFFYHENLIHPAAIAHTAPRTALIVGGGDGGAAEELLKHRCIERCTLCELDGAVIEVARDYFASVQNAVFDDPRLLVRIGDGVELVRASKDAFDLIFLDVTDPLGDAAALYSEAFYADARNALRLGGALILHIGSPFSHPQRVAQAVERLRALFRYVTPYFVYIPSYGALWGFAHASNHSDLGGIDVGEVRSRIDARGIGQRQYFNAETFHAMQVLPEYVKALIR